MFINDKCEIYALAHRFVNCQLLISELLLMLIISRH